MQLRQRNTRTFAAMVAGVALLLAASLAQARAHHEGLISSVSLGAQYSSLLTARGVVQYRDFQLDPVLALFFLDDRLEFLGTSISYRDFVYNKSVRLRTRLNRISDRPIFPSRESVREGFPQRENSYEWTARVELFLPAYDDTYAYEVNLTYNKDIAAHWGNYLDLQVKAKLGQFQFLGYHMEPNFVASVGAGDQPHNLYFYGPGAEGFGLNNIAYGLWIAFPDDADRSYPIIQLSRFEVVGSGNRNAEFAVGRNEGWLFSFIATHNFLD